ncbi:MAG TPA: hypothetical protein VEP49_16510, partial [Acidimicrobiia bacterium]|nr:hypothetical protein [Acidimicrobiia bacterium]
VDIEWGLDWLAPAAHARARVFGVTEPVAGDRVACMAWRVGYLTSALDAYVAAHRDVVVVDHEDLCRAPVDGFRDLAVALGLEWTAVSDRFLAAHDRPGVGFTMDRVAADQPGKWRARLLPAEARTAAEVLAQFPVGRTYELPV